MTRVKISLPKPCMGQSVTIIIARKTHGTAGRCFSRVVSLSTTIRKSRDKAISTKSFFSPNREPFHSYSPGKMLTSDGKAAASTVTTHHSDSGIVITVDGSWRGRLPPTWTHSICCIHRALQCLVPPLSCWWYSIKRRKVVSFPLVQWGCSTYPQWQQLGDTNKRRKIAPHRIVVGPVDWLEKLITIWAHWQLLQ